jgi:hypothetical protein
MPGKKTRRIQTRSRRGRRLVRKTRRQTKRKQRGGNIFLDSRRTPAESVIAGGVNPDIEGGTGIMRVKEDAEVVLADEEVGPSQGI